MNVTPFLGQHDPVLVVTPISIHSEIAPGRALAGESNAPYQSNRGGVPGLNVRLQAVEAELPEGSLQHQPKPLAHQALALVATDHGIRQEGALEGAAHDLTEVDQADDRPTLDQADEPGVVVVILDPVEQAIEVDVGRDVIDPGLVQRLGALHRGQELLAVGFSRGPEQHAHAGEVKQPRRAPGKVASMRRVAALYDIHGNLPALNVVLAELERENVDRIVIGGDVVNGPLPVATLDALTALGTDVSYVMGNGDLEVAAAYDGEELAASVLAESPAARSSLFAAGCISARQRALIGSFQPTVTLEIDGLGTVLFCHGSPRSDTEIITTATPDERLGEILAADDNPPTIVGGHTHRQFDRTAYRWRFINAGSVGMPYEGRVGAFWALLGPEVELRRSDYDVLSAIEELRAGGFDDVDEMFEESLLDPMDADQVAELFEQGVTS